MAAGFYFRLRFHLQDGDAIGIDTEERVLAVYAEGLSVKIKSSAKGRPIKASSQAAIVGGPFQTSDAARDAALAARRALIAWAVSHRRGIDTGDDTLRGGFFPPGLDALALEHGSPVRNDIHGIDVYESNGKTLFARLNIAAHITTSGERFVSEFATLFAHPPVVSDKVALSAELFAGSFFEVSFRARFLTLVASIETLLEPEERSESVRAFVSDAQTRAKELAVDVPTRQAIQSSLEWLKRESIGQAGRALARQLVPESSYLGMPASKFFAHCYRVRSELVHSGKPSDASIDMLELANATAQFVGDLLSRLFESSKHEHSAKG